MKKEFKKELERAEGNTEQWCAVKRLEVDFKEFIKKLKKLNSIAINENLIKEIDKLAGDLK